MSALDPKRLGWRPLAMEDRPLLHRWRHMPHVRRWYGEPLSPEEMDQKYGPRIRGEEPTSPYLLLYADRPIGYVQVYRIADHPDYARHVQVEEDAAGLDLFIGEPEFVHQGLGAHILRLVVREIAFADPMVRSCIVGPEPGNTVAIQAYEKAGFRYLKTVQVPGEPEPEYLMRLGHEAFVGEPGILPGGKREAD